MLQEHISKDYLQPYILSPTANHTLASGSNVQVVSCGGSREEDFSATRDVYELLRATAWMLFCATRGGAMSFRLKVRRLNRFFLSASVALLVIGPAVVAALIGIWSKTVDHQISLPPWAL